MAMHKIIILLLGLAATAQAFAASPTPSSATRLAPNSLQVVIARTVVQIAQKHHYPREDLDAKLAHGVLDEYFDVLDPGRFFLTNKAIQGFHHAYDQQLVDGLRNGNLKPAFAIYRYYIKQVHRQIYYALRLLKKKPDFSAQSSYRFERRHAPWEPDQSALDQLWRERVKNDALVVMLNKKPWTEAVTMLTQRYRHALMNAEQTTSADVFGAYMNAYMETLDPHSSYFTAIKVHQIQKEMAKQLQGIGAQLKDCNGYVTVISVPTSESSKLKPGDRVIGVGQGKSGKINDVTGWRLNDVIKLIRGHAGTVVRLQILPPGAFPGGAGKTVRLVRTAVEPEGERAHARTALITVRNHTYKIGIIKIPSFYMNFLNFGTQGLNTPSVTNDVRALLAKLKAEKVSGILLDLRYNGGGALEQTAALAGLFIPNGPVVQVQYRSGDTQKLNIPRGGATVWNGPLALLMNRFSASATEIFAGALKDYHRALVLGSRTWGNGTVQTLVPLRSYLPGLGAGQIKLNIAQFFRVNGSSTQLRGVSPDIAIPSPINNKEFGESSFQNALPWKSIPPVDYKPENYFVSHLLPKLQTYFKTTLQKEPDYRLFKRGISLQRSMAALTTVPLSLNAREKVLAKQHSQILTLDNAWRRLKDKPIFKNLNDANDNNFSSPDVTLEVGEKLLAEYVNLLPHKQAPFKGIITVLPPPATSTCAATLQAAQRLEGCVDRPRKAVPAPNIGTTTGG